MRTSSCSSAVTSIIGYADPAGGRHLDLEDWARRFEAKIICDEDGFTLWVFGDPSRCLHRIASPTLCGVLAGELYIVSEDCRDRKPRSLEQAIASEYERAGPSFLFELAGQFSICLWDRGRRELLLFRDDSGARSLYYACLTSRAVVFSDRLDLLVTSPLIEKRLARRSLHEFLRFLDVSAPNTIYEGVYATEPGILLRVQRGNLRQEQLGQPEDAPRPESLEAAASELEHRLAAAVATLTAIGDTTVVFLSGGVDSSLICALAAAAAADWKDTRVEALTVGFDEQGFDESGAARRIARHLGVAHRILSFPMHIYREAFEALTTGICYPSADPAGVPTLLAFKAAREFADSALDGTGADTLFGVMPARHQRIAVQFGTLLPRQLRRRFACGLKNIPQLSGYAPLVDFDDPEEILIRWRGWQRTDLEALCGEPVSLTHTRFYRLFRQFPRSAHLQRYSALLGNLPDDRIHQASALTGLDVRFPYFDPRVTEWVKGLDLHLRYNHTESKRVLKAVLARHVPRKLWEQPKHGFDFPFVQLMTFEDCALVRRYLDPDVTERWNLFDARQIDAVKQAFLRERSYSAFDPRSSAFKTWALMVLFAWLENHYRHL